MNIKNIKNIKKKNVDDFDKLLERVNGSKYIRKSMIHGKAETLEAKIFYFWISYFKNLLIHDMQLNLYFIYSKDDPEKREPAPYSENALSITTEAMVDMYDIDRQVNVCFNLSKTYDIDNIKDLFYYIGLTAFHETMHIVMVDFTSFKRTKDNKLTIKDDVSDIMKDEHKLIMNYENNIYPIIFESVYDKICNFFK